MSWEPLKFGDFPREGLKCIGIKMPEPAPIYDGMPCVLDAPDIFERLLLGEQVQLR
jgi:hypothetical protein